ncbi:MAG: hypothetical protein KIC89_21385, partial [Acetobacteraceae bacterium]|nr:hypothetical protein [Acetobacteraceae bacterium]
MATDPAQGGKAREGEVLPPSGQPSLSTPLLRAAAEQSPAAVLAVLTGPVGEAVAEAARYAGRALADNTRRAYAADWADFAAWCATGGVAALPAQPVVVAAYLASLARKLGRSGLRRR